jgi:hypothetical protein
MTKPGVIGDLYAGDTGDFRRRFGNATTVFACDQQVDIATNLLRSSNGVQGCRSNFVIIVFNDYQISHD